MNSFLKGFERGLAFPFLLPIMLFGKFWEWWHFGPSQKILRLERKARQRIWDFYGGVKP